MKKINYLFLIFITGTSSLFAKPVPLTSAKNVAEKFYKQNSKTELVSSTLVYTEMSASGFPLYFAFNINSKDGFVLVSAEDAIKPIIGYSTEGNFVVPKANTTVGHWLKEQSKAINAIRNKGIVADEKVSNEWLRYSTNNTTNLRLVNSNNNILSTVSPLTQTTWNQSPYYNEFCPSTDTLIQDSISVTGCVATAMAQIMKYWNYPAQGTGSSSYCDCTPQYAVNYGTLSANYGATTYNWANMPLAVNSPNYDVAQLMFQCGVSVDMNYTPDESGAWVITADDSICAQHSYIKYFGYNPYTIQGLVRTYYTDSVWIQLLDNELINGRVVQYVGNDPTEGGHTWVCDGFDIHNNFHMNWGWGGYDNGYYSINNLNTGGYDPSTGHQALIGIVPITLTTNQAAIPSIISPIAGCNDTLINSIVKLQNYGSNTLSSCVINYQIDNGAIQTYSWTGSLTSGQTINVNLPSFVTAAGSHTLVCYTSSANNMATTNFANSQSSINFYIVFGTNTPLTESFETTTSLPNSMWNISHTSTTGGVDFISTSLAAATGSKSVMIDNMNNIAGNNSMLQTVSSYDMTNFTTPVLTFKAAYQQKATTNADKLQIFTSTDCGATWTARKTITSSVLASLAGGTGTSPYNPIPSQFTTYTVNINGVASNHNVMFRWEFLADPNGPGNNLYIDDINIIDNVAGIQNIKTDTDFNIYPNPTNGNFIIETNTAEKQNIQVFDVTGKLVLTQTINGKATIDASNLSEGVYNISITGITGVAHKRLVIVK